MLTVSGFYIGKGGKWNHLYNITEYLTKGSVTDVVIVANFLRIFVETNW